MQFIFSISPSVYHFPSSSSSSFGPRQIFEESFFLFIKKIVIHDKDKSLEAIFDWVIQLFNNQNQISIDFLQLFDKLEAEKKERVETDINEWLKFKKIER